MSIPTTPVHSSFFYGQEPVSRARTPNLPQQPPNVPFYQLENSSMASVVSLATNPSTTNLSLPNLPISNSLSNLGTYHHNPSVYYSTDSLPKYSPAAKTPVTAQFPEDKDDAFLSSPEEMRFCLDGDNKTTSSRRWPNPFAAVCSLLIKSVHSVSRKPASPELPTTKSRSMYSSAKPYSPSRPRRSLFRICVWFLSALFLLLFFYQYSFSERQPSSFLADQGVASNGPWSVSYSPIDAAGSCKRPNEIVQDLKDIYNAGFPTVKFDSPDCSVLQALDFVPKLNVVMGLYPYEYQDEDHPQNAPKTRMQRLLASLSVQIQEIAYWNQWNRIKVVVVGSSGIFHQEYSQNELVTMLHHVRRILKGDPERFREAQRLLRSVHQGLGLTHITITTAEPVQSFISQTRYTAESVGEYHKYNSQQMSKFHEKAAGIAQAMADKDASLSNLTYANIFNLNLNKKASVQPNADEKHKYQELLFAHDAYLQAASEPLDDDDLCPHVDVIGLVVRPYFDKSVSFETAGQLLERDTKFSHYLCSNKFIGAAHRQNKNKYNNNDNDDDDDNNNNNIKNSKDINSVDNRTVVVLEAGWPNRNHSDSEITPKSIFQQRQALRSIVHARDPYTDSRIPVALFSWSNEEWRTSSKENAEQRFGIKDQFYGQFDEDGTKQDSTKDKLSKSAAAAAARLNTNLKNVGSDAWDRLMQLF